MKRTSFILFLVLTPLFALAQVSDQPRGCFAGTNGTHPDVLAHPDARGVLLTEKWSNIEQTPGVYDFTSLNSRINTVKAAGLKYALAFSGGAFGSPDWLMDSLNVDYHTFQYRDEQWRLPLWWDTMGIQKLNEFIAQIGNQYAADSMLSHVYVTQMTVNGIEGHLNGVNMEMFAADGFTNEKWITAAINTTYAFVDAFPDNPIVFEVHEIDQDTIVPAAIMNALAALPGLCNRLGLGMWWLSGKTSYQTDLIEYIRNFPGSKYAQVIGRSDQPERFKDSLYSTVFTQAKELGIRYIEPWPYEFQHHTHDALIQDFNTWTDAHFSSTNDCIISGTDDKEESVSSKPTIYPNPTNGLVHVKIDHPYQKIQMQLFDLNGKKLLSVSDQTELDISWLPKGVYYIKLTIDNKMINQRLIYVE